MPTRTPAERERLAKKHKRARIAMEVAFVVTIAVFLIIYEKHGALARLGSGFSSTTPEPTETDIRIEYFCKLGISDYVVGEDAVRAAVVNEKGFDDQLIVSEKGGMLAIVYKAAFDRADVLPPGYSTVFSGVDRPPSGEELKDNLLDICSVCSNCLLPLFGDKASESFESKLLSALAEIYAGVKTDGSKSASFIQDVFTVTAEYDDALKMLTVSAVPAE